METPRIVPEPPDSPENLAQNLEVLTPQQFLADFRREAARATTRVVGQTTQIEPDWVGDAVFDIFAAAPDGIDKTLFVDNHANLVFGNMPDVAVNRLTPTMRAQLDRLKVGKQELFGRLRNAGVTVKFMNQPQEEPQGFLDKVRAGTHINHIKAAQVDDDIFYLGGFNFLGEAAEAADFMVKFTGETARQLAEAFQRLHSDNTPRENFPVALGDGMELLVDVGTSEKSLVIDRAKEMIGRAEESVEFTSQWVPDAPIAQSLSDASKRGKRVEVVTSKRGKVGSVLPLTYAHGARLINTYNRLANWVRKFRVPLLIDRKRQVHAKLLIVDGKQAIFGSHNLYGSEARTKVANWSIATTNAQLVSNLQHWYEGIRAETSSI